MQTRQLGATGLSVSEIGFGTWAIGGAGGGVPGYGATDDAESLTALAEACTLGCTVFDTSNLYGWGHAETLLGRALAGHRASAIIATKAGYTTPEGAQDFSSAAIRTSVEASLWRLATDRVDLLQLHNPPPELADDEWLLAGMESLRDDGLIRAWGVSARTPDEALHFVSRAHPDCVQVNFNLADLRALRNGLFDACRDRGIGVIVRTPLAAGFLTGQIPADATFGPADHRARYDAATRARWAAAVQRLRPLFGDAPEATPAQNAIRFCLSFDAVSAVIPGMMRAAEVRENLAASRLPRLDAARLDAVGAIYDEVFG